MLRALEDAALLLLKALEDDALLLQTQPRCLLKPSTTVRDSRGWQLCLSLAKCLLAPGQNLHSTTAGGQSS